MSSCRLRAGAMRVLMLAVLTGLGTAASAAMYTAPSGYFQIIGYKLQRVERDGGAGLAVDGWVQALANCRGAVLQFEVRDRGDRPVGVIRIAHGPFFRHDRWVLGPGEFTPQGGDAAAAIAAADHVVVRETECTSE